MSDIDLSLEGLQETARAFRELEDEIDDDGVTYVAGSAVEYGVYLEFGTEDMPPYSWFRPAVREFKANPETFIVERTGYSSIDDIPNTKAVVQAVAVALQSQMENNVSAVSSSNRSPGVDPDHPKRDTGTLVNSISAQRIA